MQDHTRVPSISDKAVYIAAKAAYGRGFDHSPSKDAWLNHFREALEVAAGGALRLHAKGYTAERDEAYDAKTERRFWKKVNKTESCWLWTGNVSTNGYGVLQLLYPSGKRRHIRAHRYSWEMANGAIPDGRDIDHICHVILCVNPDHLRATTRKQNLEHRTGANSNSKSGVRGVYWDSYKQRWTARVGHNGKSITVGRFTDLAEAEAAVIAKRNELHTHNNLDRLAI